MNKRILFALGALLTSSAHAHSVAQLEEFSSNFVVDIAHYFAGTEHIFLTGDIQQKIAHSIAQSFATKAAPLTCRTEAVLQADTVADEANNMQFEVSVHLRPNHSADELGEALQELSNEIDEWHETVDIFFVLDEARTALATAMASRQNETLEEAVDAMLPIIRAEAGTTMSPYTISGVRVDRVGEADEENPHRFEIEVNCQKPSMYDKSLYVRGMLEVIEHAYGRVVDGERAEGVRPEGIESAMQLLRRANSLSFCSEPAAKHLASLTQLVANAYDRTDVVYVVEDLHRALCAEFTTYLQREVVGKAQTSEQLKVFNQLMSEYSGEALAGAGMPEGIFLFNDEGINAFDGNLEQACKYVAVELQAFESSDIHRLWSQAQATQPQEAEAQEEQ